MPQSFTVAESDGSVYTFNQIASTGYETRYLGSHSTFACKDEILIKTTPASESIDAVARHVVSFRRTRFNSVTGKRSMTQTQLVNSHTNNPDILADDQEDGFAIVSNLMSGLTAAQLATFNTRVGLISLGGSPV